MIEKQKHIKQEGWMLEKKKDERGFAEEVLIDALKNLGWMECPPAKHGDQLMNNHQKLLKEFKHLLDDYEHLNACIQNVSYISQYNVIDRSDEIERLRDILEEIKSK
jgi:hypothetical protein